LEQLETLDLEDRRASILTSIKSCSLPLPLTHLISRRHSEDPTSSVFEQQTSDSKLHIDKVAPRLSTKPSQVIATDEVNSIDELRKDVAYLRSVLTLPLVSDPPSLPSSGPAALLKMRKLFLHKIRRKIFNRPFASSIN
jgi:hypothetical protein